MALLVASDSIAADLACGVDTDLNGSVDNLCPGLDQDLDGYTSDGSAGYLGLTETDCDDTNIHINPSAGENISRALAQVASLKLVIPTEQLQLALL